MNGTMINLDIVILLLVAHYVADFLAQTRWMATNKSSNFLALLTHVSVYTLVMLVYVGIILYINTSLSLEIILYFVLFNGFAHLVVDYFSSKLTSYYWKIERYDNFWYIIGFDQLLHTIILLSSFVYIMR